MKMVCYYFYYFLDLKMVPADFSGGGFSRHLHQVLQGKYVVFNETDFYSGKRKICCDCVGKIGGGGLS